MKAIRSVLDHRRTACVFFFFPLNVYYFRVVCPLHTGLVRCLQPVLVSRKDPDSRKNTIQEIESRAKSAGHWPQVSCNLLIFYIFHVQRTHAQADVYEFKHWSSDQYDIVLAYELSFSKFSRPWLCSPSLTAVKNPLMIIHLFIF